MVCCVPSLDGTNDQYHQQSPQKYFACQFGLYHLQRPQIPWIPIQQGRVVARKIPIFLSSTKITDFLNIFLMPFKFQSYFFPKPVSVEEMKNIFENSSKKKEIILNIYIASFKSNREFPFPGTNIFREINRPTTTRTMEWYHLPYERIPSTSSYMWLYFTCWSCMWYLYYFLESLTSRSPLPFTVPGCIDIPLQPTVLLLLLVVKNSNSITSNGGILQPTF